MVNLDELKEESVNLASLKKRAFGASIDTLILLFILVPIMLATFDGFQEAATIENMSFGQTIRLPVIGFASFLLLNGYLLYQRGQTIGKVLMKTRIVDMDGNIPSFLKIIVLRYLIFLLASCIPFPVINIDIIGIINPLFIFGKDRRCLHDYVAGTRVINIETEEKV